MHGHGPQTPGWDRKQKRLEKSRSAGADRVFPVRLRRYPLSPPPIKTDNSCSALAIEQEQSCNSCCPIAPRRHPGLASLPPPNHNRLLERHPHLRNALKLLGRKVELRARDLNLRPSLPPRHPPKNC